MEIETFINGDVVTTLMRDVFTVAERSMIGAGMGDSVLSTRMRWQDATTATFKADVSAATGREVLTVISGFELDEEIATEVFLLAPVASP